MLKSYNYCRMCVCVFSVKTSAFILLTARALIWFDCLLSLQHTDT